MKSIISRVWGNHPYSILFFLTLVILLAKLPGLWLSPTLLPGWDVSGHYYAFLKQIELIGSGHLRGYILGWFGGMPLFYFYSPLFFWLSGLSAISLSFIPPVLIFKWSILFSLAALTPAFYYFSKVFLPIKPNPLIALSLSLLFIFFQPYEFGNLGIGLSGAVASGLISQGPGIVLSLVFLALFKRLLDSPLNFWQDRYFYLAIIFGSALVYTHILSAIFTAIFSIMLCLFYIRKKISFLKSSFLILSIFFVSAYFILPFLYYYQYSSGWGYRRTEGYFIDPLQPLLAFDLLDLYYGRFAVFNWPWLAVMVASVGGFVALVRKKLFIIPTLFLFTFLIIPRNYLPQMLSGIPMQYYRIMPMLILLCLVTSLYGFSLFLDLLWENKKYVRLSWVFGPLIISLTLWRILAFSFAPDGYNIKPNLLSSTVNPIKYYQNFSLYPDHTSVNSLLGCIKQLPVGGGRIAVDNDLHLMMQKLGSAHYFNLALPALGYPVVQGLYSESANQTAFIYPPFAILSPAMGESSYPISNYLMWNDIYRHQAFVDSIKQMGLFNTQYLVAFHTDTKENIASLESGIVEQINCPNTDFSLYSINGSLRRPYLSYPEFKPVLYITAGNDYLSFRKLSLGWYTVSDLFNTPIIYKHDLRISSLAKLPISELENISAIIVGSEGLSQSDIGILEETGKPILILADKEYGNHIGLSNKFEIISHFKPVADFDEYNQPYFPDQNALSELQSFIDRKVRLSQNKIRPTEPISLSVWQDDSISFTASGPTIINASYFPVWQSQKDDQTVYEVTPGQMLIFAAGSSRLEFRATPLTFVSGVISLLSFSLLLFFGLKKKYHVK